MAPQLLLMAGNVSCSVVDRLAIELLGICHSRLQHQFQINVTRNAVQDIRAADTDAAQTMFLTFAAAADDQQSQIAGKWCISTKDNSHMKFFLNCAVSSSSLFNRYV